MLVSPWGRSPTEQARLELLARLRLPFHEGCGKSWARVRVPQSRRLTLPSRGCPKGCAFCAPLMSNVRPTSMNAKSAPSYASRVAYPGSLSAVARLLSALLRLKSRFASAVCLMQEQIPSVVLRTVSHQGTCRCSSTAGAMQLVSSSVATQRLRCRHPRPNPSVEGTAKRLRLLSAPHLER
jgi:hypothetical protein